MIDLDALRRRARELGVEPFYWDDEGHRHDANVEAMARVVEVVEADYARSSGRRLHPVFVGSPGPLHVGSGVDQVRLRLGDGTEIDVPVVDGDITFNDPLPIGTHTLSLAGASLDESSTIVVAPAVMPRSAALAGRAGVFAPTYALWERSAPLPGLDHLAALSRALPALGADVLVTLPLYAGFFDEPFDPSPYAPVSRQHWNEVYLEDRKLPAAPIPEFGELIDWRVLAKRRRAQLLRMAANADSELRGRVQRWLATRPDVCDYARFRATVMPDPTDDGHPVALIEASHHLAQYLADEQLSLLEGPGSAALALDLPIGSHPGGYETWANRDLFAPAMAIGAPPDALFKGGQNWGFPPQLPGEAERSGFALWRTLIASCGRYSSMLRIDHVLGLHRLWWVPDGMSAGDGVYVRYPRRRADLGDRRRGDDVEHNRRRREPRHGAAGDLRPAGGVVDARPARRAPVHRQGPPRQGPQRAGWFAGHRSGHCGMCAHARHGGMGRALSTTASWRSTGRRSRRSSVVPSPTPATGCSTRPTRGSPSPTRTSRSPTSTTSSARRRHTTSPARSCRRSGGGDWPSRPRRPSPIRGCDHTWPR